MSQSQTAPYIDQASDSANWRTLCTI